MFILLLAGKNINGDLMKTDKRSENARKRKDPQLKKSLRCPGIAQGLNNSTDNIKSDVLGSYTGITETGESPVQDADDL